MRKLSTFALLAVASAAASAQSNVTLFGVVDVNVRAVNNGDGTLKSVSNGGLNRSRLGVRGSEDLGGGLQAGFWLETGINPDSGTAQDSSRFWNRRTTVSLSSQTLGEIRLGRDYTPTYNSYTSFDTFGSNGIAAVDKFFPSSLGVVGATTPAIDTDTRADNLVSYFTPKNLNGFYGQVSVAAGEGASGKRYYGGRAGYSTGPVDVSVAYGQTKVAPAVAGGEEKVQLWNLGASYDFGPAKVLGVYGQTKYNDLKLDVIEIGTQVPLGLGVIRASFVHANAKGIGIDDNDSDQIALGYIHNLSKRTALYGTAARVKNKGSATFALATPPAMLVGHDSKGVEFGIRHSF
jgi:predicted porin